MDRVTKEMFELILNKLDGMDGRFDNLEGRFDRLEGRFDNLEGRFGDLEGRFGNLEGRVGSLEGEVKEFRAEMKDQIKGLDGKMDMIYNRLKSDIDELKPVPGAKYTVVKEQ